MKTKKNFRRNCDTRIKGDKYFNLYASYFYGSFMAWDVERYNNKDSFFFGVWRNSMRDSFITHNSHWYHAFQYTERKDSLKNYSRI